MQSPSLFTLECAITRPGCDINECVLNGMYHARFTFVLFLQKDAYVTIRFSYWVSFYEVQKRTRCVRIMSVCLWLFLSDYTFCRIFMKFGVEVIYKGLSRKHEFRENWISDSHCLLRDRNEFLSYFPHFLSCLNEIQWRMSYLMLLTL